MVQQTIALLGCKATDRVTGFAGVITSVAFDLYGCVQAAIVPAIDKDGKFPEGHWFDVNRLEVTDRKPVMQRPEFVKSEESRPVDPTSHAKGPAEKPTMRH